MGFEYLSFGAGGGNEEYLWTINDQDGGLYRVSRKNFKAEFIRTAVEEPKIGEPEYDYAVYDNGKVHFLPFRSTGRVLIYDIKIDKLITIELNIKESYLFTVLKVGMNVWLFPHITGKALLRYSIPEEKIEYLHIWNKLSITYNIMVHSAVAAFGKIWLCTYNSPKVTELDIKNFKVKPYILGKYKLGNIDFDGKKFWFSLINEPGIISWTKDKNIVKKYERNTKIENSFTSSTYTLVCIKEKVILLPLYEKKVYIVNQKKEIIESMPKMPLYFRTYNNYNNHVCFFGYEIVNDHLWIFPACGSHLLVLTLNDMELKSYELKNTNIELVYKQYLSRSSLIVENSDSDKCSLKGYLRVISVVEAEDQREKETKYGVDIIRTIKSEL